MKFLEVENPFTSLNPNMSGGLYRRTDREATKELQQWLNDNGYNAGKIDGIYGPNTMQAVRNFQADAGLKKDGDAGKNTISMIIDIETGKTPAPTKRMRGVDPSVKDPKSGNVIQLLKHYARKYRISEKFVMAIANKESNMNPDAIGDKNLKHKAYGIMQVRKPAMLDVNKAFGTNYTEEDLMRLDPRAIAEVGVGYLAVARDKYGASSFGEMAAIYNGGPNGVNNSKAMNYARDVMQRMA